MLLNTKISNKIHGAMFHIAKKLIFLNRDQLYRNSYYIMVNSVNSGVTGLIFWIIVARLLDVQSVGLAIVIISASSSVVNISLLGVGTSIIRYLSNEKDKINFINISLTIVGVSCIIISLIFVMGISIWAKKLEFILWSPLYIIIFTFFTTVSALSSTFINIYVAQRDTKYFFLQSAISDIIRLFFPFILINLLGAIGVFSSLGISNFISFIISVLYFSKKVVPSYKLYPELRLELIKKIESFSMGNYFVNLISNVPFLVIPFLILHFLTPEDNAYFYMAFSIASLLFMIPISLSTSLFAEGSFREETFIPNLRKVVIHAYGLVLLAITLIIFFGNRILLLFGPAYSVNSSQLLTMLAISCIFLTLNSFYTTYLKVKLKIIELIMLNVFLSISILTLSYFLIQEPFLNINGVGIAYIFAQGLMSLYVVLKLRVIPLHKIGIKYHK